MGLSQTTPQRHDDSDSAKISRVLNFEAHPKSNDEDIEKLLLGLAVIQKLARKGLGASFIHIDHLEELEVFGEPGPPSWFICNQQHIILLVAYVYI